MNLIDFRKTDFIDGFWKNKLNLVSEVSIYNIYNRFKETGRFDALDCGWKKGEPNEPHIFWDSDIAKWIESVSFLLEKKAYPDLEKIIDEIAEKMENNADENGYFNSCYLVHDKPRWSDRTDHELYCLGHLIEAVVAYFKATGKRKLLDVTEKYLDYVYQVFIVDGSAAFKTPGHEEIELALIKLYELTQNKKYLRMCTYFIDNRGNPGDSEYSGVAHKYSQSHIPVREQLTAEGHCVRACYLYTAMADLVRYSNDEKLLKACKSIFDDIINKKMYITGGIGSAARGEAFTVPYDLPDLTAYSESCAALSLAWFAQRMLLIENDSKYSDTIERILYNNALSSVSLDGKAFFYTNPLAIRTHLLERNTSQVNTRENLPVTQRKEVFDCSCCPPNITRFIASVADFLYTYDDGTVYVHQFMNSTTSHNNFEISQKTDYPNSGKIEITAKGIKNLAVRIPAWCESFSLYADGKNAEYTLLNGYAHLKNVVHGSVIELNLDVAPFIVYPTSKVKDCISRCAVQRGPVIYCAEGIDNDFSVMSFCLDSQTEFKEEFDVRYNTIVLSGTGSIPIENTALYSRKKEERVPAEIKLIPYFAFANNGESDMEVFLHYC